MLTRQSVGALSYFIGGNPDLPEDAGFALKRWAKVRYDHAAENGVQIHADVGITMDNFYLTNIEGSEMRPAAMFRRELGIDLSLRSEILRPDRTHRDGAGQPPRRLSFD